MKKAAIFLATGFETVEALNICDLLRRMQTCVMLVSTTGEWYVTSSHNVSVKCDVLLADADFDSFDMIIFPGGMPGTTNLEANTYLMSKLDEFYKTGKYVAAICAAPTILGHRGLLKGRKACCFPGMEEGLEGAEVVFDDTVTDGNIITARGMGCSTQFGLAAVKVLYGDEAAEALAKKIVW